MPECALRLRSCISAATTLALALSFGGSATAITAARHAPHLNRVPASHQLTALSVLVLMETIEVHSKDYLVRWVHTVPGSRVTWKVMPTKRSINFGVYERGGGEEDSKTIIQKMSQTVGSTSHRLDAAGCIPLAYNGFVRVESKDTLEGSAQVDNAHMIAFVFDNTFSKSYSKHVEFTFHVEHPASRAPHRSASVSGPHARNNEAAAAATAALYAKDPHGSNVNLHEEAGMPSRRSHESPGAQSQQQFPPIEPHSNAAPQKPASSNRRERTDSSQSTDDSEPGKSSTVPGAPLRQRQSTLSSSGGNETELVHSLDGRYVTGFLQKKRRKQFQGFGRRYFSLDKTMGLLNYYLNARSRSLRGVMPVRIADLSADPKTLQLTLDSGMEKWTLKAGDPASFEAWQKEFEEVRSTGIHDSDSETEADPAAFYDQSALGGPAEDYPKNVLLSKQGESILHSTVPPLQDLKNYITEHGGGSDDQTKLESIYDRLLVSSLSGGAGDRTPRPAATTVPSSATITTEKNARSSVGHTKGSTDVKDLLVKSKKGCFTGMIAGMLVGSLFGSFAVLVLIGGLSACLGSTVYLILNPELLSSHIVGAPSPASVKEDSEKPRTKSRTYSSGESQHRSMSEDEDDLSGDSGAEEDLPTSNKSVSYVPQKPRHTADFNKQLVSEEQQAGEYETEDPEVAAVFRRMTEKNKKAREDASARASETSTSSQKPPGAQAPETSVSKQGLENKASTAPSTAGAAGVSTTGASSADGSSAETSLYPLPHRPVKRRVTIKGPSQPPPSLMSMLKKARDPNGMVAPVTANEPLTGLQYTAEIFENSSMLDAASHAPPKSHLRVMLVAVFAVARLSGVRCKERALRKPFTPLLGETYEIVREDRGLRFVAEKVMHKPEVIATQTESPHWTAHFTSRPHSKMWAKTVQITDVGHFNVTFPDGESISYLNPELFIRNILAGERYLEPSGSFTVESSAGHKYTATVEFKSKGMFGGRSEEVTLTCGDLVYEGKWAEAIYNKGKVVWSAKPLVAQPQSHYGWPLFAAQLNEITPIEDKQLPPNDSRLRPDLRHYENQDVDKAEELKLRLEQHQRERRKELEVAGKQHEPFFFIKSNDEKGHYMLRQGQQNYWVRREAHNWSSVPNWFQ